MNSGVYVVGNKKLGWYKIGRSSCLSSRLAELSWVLPFDIDYQQTYPVPAGSLCEKRLQKIFQAKQLRGEWFELSAEDLASIPQHLTEIQQMLFGEPTTGKALAAKLGVSRNAVWRFRRESRARKRKGYDSARAKGLASRERLVNHTS